MSTSNEGSEERQLPLPAEEQERAMAWRRGEAHDAERAAGRPMVRAPYSGRAEASVAATAFAALAENVRDYAVFLMNRDGVITFWGEGARLIKWWTKAQAEGAHLRLLYPVGGSEDGTAEEHLQSAAEHGEYTGEGLRVRNDGSTFWAGITLTALRDEHGALLGFAKVTRDLTARRAADALLQAAAESAEAARAEAVTANRAKSGFLATMSHEIRTPVNAIMGYLELLELEIDGPLTSGQRRHVLRASASSRHLVALIGEILDFSRIEAERMTVEESTFRIGQAVSGALGLVLPQARARGLEVVDAVSGFAAELAARGDEARVRQILVNLLANAVKFTEPRDGESGRITISAGTASRPPADAQVTGDGPWVYVRVEDTGVGIRADRLEPIFEPFVQGDMELTRAHGGTGLGLAISRRLARLMDGDVTARSEVGIGSTFFLWLPTPPAAAVRRHDAAVRPAVDRGEQPMVERTADAPSERPLRVVADAVLADLERVLHAYVARLRSDPATPSAHVLEEALIEDHLASFLSDLSTTLTNLDGAPGEAVAAVRDSTAIQRLVAERHGAQRARLGWTETELRREFGILREELGGAVRRRAPGAMRGPTPEVRAAAVERALEVLARFLSIAEGQSLASFRHRTGSAAHAREDAPGGAAAGEARALAADEAAREQADRQGEPGG